MELIQEVADSRTHTQFTSAGGCSSTADAEWTQLHRRTGMVGMLKEQNLWETFSVHRVLVSVSCPADQLVTDTRLVAGAIAVATKKRLWNKTQCIIPWYLDQEPYNHHQRLALGFSARLI